MPVPSQAEAEVLSELGAASLAEYIDYAIGQTFDDTIYQLTDLPNFVADSNPVSPAANVSRQATRLACRAWARGGGPQNLPGFDAVWGGICGPYLESIGEDPSPGSLALPFSGGQCEGVVYDINWSWSAGTFNSGPQNAQRTGPLTFSREGTGTVDCGPGGQTYNVYVLLSSGTPLNLASGCGAVLNSLTVTPLDGSPDVCGNPPPLYDPPRIRPSLPAVPRTPIDFPGIGPIDVDVNFDPDGTINVGLPDIGIEVGIEDPFGFGDDGGDGGGPPGGPNDGPPGDVGDPGQPVAIGPGGDAEGVAPEGSVLTGVRVQIVGVPESRSKYTEDVYRGAYYVYMGVPGLLDHDPAGAMARLDQFVFAEKDNLTAWRVRANSRYELITTPYYRPVEG